jgi:hypothetical protein
MTEPKVQPDGHGPYAVPSIPKISDPTKKRRGRPPGPPKEKKPRNAPDCEKRPMEYPNRIVVWGTEPKCERWKRKGLAILYDPSRGKHYILMPVTDDSGEIRWRYRWIPNAVDKYRYEQIDLEPGMIPETIQKLREIALALEQGLEWIGGVVEAKKVEAKVVEEIKESQAGDKTEELMKKLFGKR